MKDYRIHEALCNFRLSTLLKMWNFKYVGNSSVAKRFVGPGTFLAGLELYEVAGPAGLDLIKLKIGHCLQGIWLIQLIMIFCYFNYIQILSIYEHSRDQYSLLLTWISNHMPSVGLNHLFIPKLQVLHFRARFSDSIFGFNIRTRYSDSIFGLDIRIPYSDSIFGRDSQTRFLHLNFELG